MGKFKMKGTTLYGKPTGKGGLTKGDLTVSRTGNENKDDGRAKSSAFQKNGDKKSMKQRDEDILKKAADRDKVGGPGVSNLKESEDLVLAQTRDQASKINKMSKKELLQATGNKTNIVSRLTKSKKKLKGKLRGDLSKEYYARKGGGGGMQAEQSKLKKDDKYTGVSGT